MLLQAGATANGVGPEGSEYVLEIPNEGLELFDRVIPIRIQPGRRRNKMALVDSGAPFLDVIMFLHVSSRLHDRCLLSHYCKNLSLFLYCIVLIQHVANTTTSTAGAAAAMTSTKSGAIIFLHGLGDSPAGWSHLRGILSSIQPRLSQLEYVFPAAPIIPLSINGGGHMSGWFDLYDWPIEVGAKDDPERLQAGVAAVEQHVKNLNAKGIPNEKIILGGFSQGGAIALLAAYQATTTYAGCVGLSAWLTLPDQWKVSDAAQKTPMYWGHGTYDDKVVFAQQAFGVGKLREQGVDIKDETYQIGHSTHPKEMRSFADFVDQRIFGQETATNEL